MSVLFHSGLVFVNPNYPYDINRPTFEVRNGESISNTRFISMTIALETHAIYRTSTPSKPVGMNACRTMICTLNIKKCTCNGADSGFVRNKEEIIGSRPEIDRLR